MRVLFAFRHALVASALFFAPPYVFDVAGQVAAIDAKVMEMVSDLAVLAHLAAGWNLLRGFIRL